MKKAKYLKYYLAGSVALITFIVYLTCLRNDFVEWDDGAYVFENSHIHSLNAAFFRWAFFDFYAANWHPLTWISHALDYALWGLNPLGHHLTNIVLHAINVFLVVLLAIRLLEAWKERTGRNGLSSFPSGQAILIAAGTTGLLFGLHPIHVESVAWVAERKDLLCALFFLLSITWYSNYVRIVTSEVSHENPFSQFFNRYYLCALGFFIFALMSKPMAVTLPVVLLLLDWYPFNRIRSFNTSLPVLAEKLPFIILSLLSSMVTILAQKAGGALTSINAIPLSTRVLVGTKALVVYLVKTMWPLNLIPLYPYPKTALLLSPEYLVPIAIVVGITVVSIVHVKKQKLWLATWSYYVITLLPVLGFVQVGSQSMADRYTYLPSLGLFLMVGLVVASVSQQVDILKRWRLLVGIAGTIAVLLAFILLTYLTTRQIGIWKNSYTLWSYVIEKAPTPVPQAYFSLGIVFGERKQFDKAIAYYDQAIALDPAYYEAYENRGFIFEKMGQLDRAIGDYNTVIALKPDRYRAYYNRGIAFGKKGQLDMALADYDQVIALSPSNYDAYNNRGTVFGKTGRLDKALADYDQAITLDSSRYEAFYNRGTLFEKTGQPDKALADYDRATILNPSYYSLYLREGVLCDQAGMLDKALEYFNMYIEKNPNNAEAYGNRGITYALMGQYESALKDLNRTIELDKNSAVAYFNPGNIYMNRGQKKPAVADYQKACALGYKDGCNAVQ
jgi:tetratricopeptide (TPR) repeat protein